MSAHTLDAVHPATDGGHLPWLHGQRSRPGDRPAVTLPGDEEPPLRRITRRAVSTAGARLWPLLVDGLGWVPDAGPAILAANHQSFFDSVALVMAVPRPLTFVGKAEYLDDWKSRRLLPALGMIPVDRHRGRRAWGSLEVAARVLQAGGLFAIYPEGTRSRDGMLHAGHRGVGQLSIATGAPVVPVGIIGTERIQPPGARAPRPFQPATLRFGCPLRPQGYRGSDRERRRRLTADLMAAIAELSGQQVAPGRVGTAG